MHNNQPTKMQELQMEKHLYQQKIKYLKKVNCIDDLLQLKIKGIRGQKIKELSIIQNNIPFNLQMEIRALLHDSIEHYERQIEMIDNMIAEIDY